MGRRNRDGTGCLLYIILFLVWLIAVKTGAC